MVAGDVPDTMRDCRLIGLDLGALVAGATMRGEFEERLKAVLEEVTKSEGEIVSVFVRMVVAVPRCEFSLYTLTALSFCMRPSLSYFLPHQSPDSFHRRDAHCCKSILVEKDVSSAPPATDA